MTAELELLFSPRYLAGTKGDIEVRCYRDGTLTDPDLAGTVTLTDGDGTVLSTGAATVAGSGSGIIRYSPTAAAMASVNRVTVSVANVVIGGETAITVTGETEVIGELLFTEAEARAFRDGQLASATYTDDAIRRAHDQIMDGFERVLGYPLGRRYYRDVLDGEGYGELRLSRGYVRSIRAIASRAVGTATWTAFTAGELADVLFDGVGAEIVRETGGVFASGRQNWRVSYEAGRPIPLEIRRAALVVVRNTLVPSNVSDRALFENNQAGQFRLAVSDPGHWGRWYGLPEADGILARYAAVTL